MNLEAQSGFNQQNQDIPTNPFKKNKRFGGVQKSSSPINQSRIQPKTKPQIQNQFYKNQQEHSNINENNQVVQQDVSQKQNQPAYQPTRCNSSLIIMNFNQDNSFFNYGNSENSIAVVGTPVATPRQQSLHIQGNGQEMQQQLKLSVAEQNYLKQQQMQQKDEQSLKPIQAAGSFYSNNINSQNTQVKQSYENLNIKDLQINNTYKQKIQNLIQNEEETNHENSSEVLENIMMVNLDTFPDDLCNHQDHQEERIVQPKHLDFSKKSEDIVQQPLNKSSTISPLPLCLIQEKLKQNQKTIEEYSYTAKKSARSGSSDFQHNASQQSNFSYQTFYSPRMNKNTSRQGDQVQQGSIATQLLAQKLNLSINNQQQQLNPNSVNSQIQNLSNGGSNLASQPQTIFNNFGNQNFIQNTNRNQSPHSQQVTPNPFLKIQIANGINTLERQSRQNQSPFYKNISLNQLIPANTNPGLNNQQAVISNNQNTISNPVGINIFNNTLGQIKSESMNNNNNRAVNYNNSNNNQINSDRVINQQNSFANVKQSQQPSYVQNQLNNIQMYQSLNFNLQFQQQQQQQENIKQNNIPPFSIAPRITLSRQVSANSINMNNLTTPNNGFHTLQNIQNQNQIYSQTQALSASNIYNPNQISNLSVKLIEQSSNANSQFISVPQTSVNLKQQPHTQNNQLKEPQTDKNIYNSSNVQNDFQEAVESVKRAAVERGKSASRVDENKTGSSQKQFVPLQGIEFPVINLDNKDKVDESYLKQIISPETLKILEEQKEIKKDIVKYRNINSPQSQGKSSQNNNDNTNSNSNSNGNNNNNNNNSNSSQQISSQNTLFSNTLSSPLAKLSNQPLGNIINVFGQLGNNNIQLSPNKQQQQQVQQYNYQNIQDVFQNVQQNYQNLPILLNQSNLAKQIPSMQEPVLSQVFNKQKQPLNYQMPTYQMKPIQIQPPAPSIGLTLLSVQKNFPQPETPIQGISLLNLPQENKIILKDIPSNNLSPSKESDKIQPQKSQAQNNLMDQKQSNISNQGEGQLTDQAKKDQNKQSGQLPEKTTILTSNQDELKNQNTRTTAAAQLHLNQLESKNQENNSAQNNQITQIKSFNLCYQTEKTEFDAEQDQPNKPKITQIIQSGRISQASSPKISLQKDERPQLIEVKSFPISINQSQQQQLLNQRETFECVGSVDIKSIQIEDNQDKKLSNQNDCTNNEIEAHMNYQNNVFAKQQNKAEQVEVVFTPQKDKQHPDPSQVESVANEHMNELESVKKALPNNNKLSPSYGYSPCFNIDKQDTQQSPNPITKINTNNTSNVLQSFGFNPYAIQQMQINEKAENNLYNSKENVNSINPILQTSNENQLLSPGGIESDNVPYVQNYNLNINNQQYFINSNFINNFQAPIVVGSINKTSFEYSELTNISDTKNIIIPGTEPIQKGHFNKSSSTNNINQQNPLQGNSNYIQIQLPQTNNQLKNNNQFDIQQNLTTESIEVDLSEKNNQQTYDSKQDLTPTLKRNMQNGLPMQTTPNNKQSQLSNKNSTPQTTDKSIRQNNSNKINSVQNSKQKYTLSGHRNSKPEDMLHEQIMELQKQTKKMIEKSQQKIKSYSQERSSHNAKQVKAEAKSPMNFEKQVNKLTDNSQVGATFSTALNKGSSSCKNNYKDHQNIVPKAEISVRKDQEPNNGYNLNLKRNSSQDIQPMRSGSTQIKQSQQENNNSLQGSFNIQMASNMNNSNNFQDKNPSILSSQTQFDTKSNSFKPKITSNTSIQSSINNSAQSKSQLKYYQNETINNLSSINSSRVNQNTSKQNNSSINSNFFQNQQNTNQLNIPLKLGMVPTIESDRTSKNDFNSQHQYIDLQNYSSTPLNSNTNISSLSNRNNNDFNNSQKTNNNQKGSQVNTNDKHKVACQWQTRSQIKNLLKMKQDTFFSHQGQSKSSMIPNDKKMNFKI